MNDGTWIVSCFFGEKNPELFPLGFRNDCSDWFRINFYFPFGNISFYFLSIAFSLVSHFFGAKIVLKINNWPTFFSEKVQQILFSLLKNHKNFQVYFIFWRFEISFEIKRTLWDNLFFNNHFYAHTFFCHVKNDVGKRKPHYDLSVVNFHILAWLSKPSFEKYLQPPLHESLINHTFHNSESSIRYCWNPDQPNECGIFKPLFFEWFLSFVTFAPEKNTPRFVQISK